MKRADRIGLINRCAGSLADRGWPEIDFLLGQFGLPTTDVWGDRSAESEFNYIREMLGSADATDDDLVALDDYLHSPQTHRVDDEPWNTEGGFRIFISHLASEKASAARLKSAFAWWGFDAFVAHKDINPGREWVDVILAALHSCDALTGLLHNGFRESQWCEQEVGIALGRTIPTLPVRVEIDPCGFFGLVQAIPWPQSDNPEAAVAQSIVDILVRDKRTSAKATETLVSALENAISYENANTLAHALVDMRAVLSSEQMGRLHAARGSNSQVRGAWDVSQALGTLEARAGKAGATIASDDVTF